MVDESALSCPDLFCESYVDYADCRTTYTTDVCRSEQGWRFLPGGTREPGETLHDLARRELMEEAGAILEGEPRYFAAHVADSNRDSPFRPHFPHPRTYWAYATVPVTIVGKPTNPADGETVVEVLTLPPVAAADYIKDHDQFHADVLRHAVALKLLPPPC